MNTGLQHYPAMKPSGVEWLGHVPQNWDVRRAKRVFSPRKEPARDDDVQLSATQAYGVIPQDEYERRVGRRVVKISRHLDKRRHVEVDDFVISMRSFQGGLERAWARGCIRSSYIVIRAAGNVNVEFFGYLFKSEAYIQALRSSADFIRDGQDLNFDNFCAVDLPFPPTEEQAAIVRYLNHVDRRINRYIRAKRRLAGFLDEERDALMRDVTRDPETQELRLGIVAQQALRFIERRDTETYEPIGLRNRGRGIFHKPPTVGSDLGDSSFFRVREGDLVLSGQFAWEGAVALANAEDDGCVTSHRYPVLRGKAGSAETPYLWALLRTQFGELLLNQHSRGAAGRNRPLSLGSLLKEKIPVPPLPAQALVVELIERHRRIAAPTSEALSRVREYRTRLIADVVTGKLDVREAAAGLPEVDPADLEGIIEIDDVVADEFDAELEEVAS